MAQQQSLNYYRLISYPKGGGYSNVGFYRIADAKRAAKALDAGKFSRVEIHKVGPAAFEGVKVWERKG